MAVNKKALTGRRKIFIDVDVIDSSNIKEVVQDVLKIHTLNARDIDYLMKYERGDTPIANREKKGRRDVDYRINENHASEIKTFKVGYVFSSPITLVQRAVKDNEYSDEDDKRIALLNEMLFEQNKAAKDKELAEDFTTCGVGYRMIFPKKRDEGELSPFDIITLNPQTTCVGYSNDMYQRPMLGISFSIKTDGTTRIGAYTESNYYLFEGSSLGGELKLLKTEINPVGMIPIIEYKADAQRMGCFERVIDLLDALSVLTSDRVNGLSQYVQNILWAHNVSLDEDQKEEAQSGGWIFTHGDNVTKAEIKYLTQELDQTSAQSLVDWVYDQVLQITGTPARGNSSGGNTGQAIVLSNGWSIAETAAKNTEIVFKESEFQALKVMLKILKDTKRIDSEMKTLRLSDIDVKFSRNKTDSILVKVQALQGQIDAGIDPLTAIKTCDLYSDPQQVYVDSKEYIAQKRGENDVIHETEDTEPGIRNSGKPER